MQTLPRKGDSLSVWDADTTSKGGFTVCVGCRHYLEREIHCLFRMHTLPHKGDSLVVWDADTTSKGEFTGCVGCRHYLERGIRWLCRMQTLLRKGDSLAVWDADTTSKGGIHWLCGMNKIRNIPLRYGYLIFIWWVCHSFQVYIVDLAEGAKYFITMLSELVLYCTNGKN
jgi:hypothetical protein